MKCPKCGFEQPVALECIRCGIVFSKFTRSQTQVLQDLTEEGHELNETRPVDIDSTPATYRQDAPMPANTVPLTGTSTPAAPDRDTAPGGTPAPLTSAPLGKPLPPSPLDQPIRAALRYVRLFAGLFAISFGSLLFWAGEAVAPEPAEALFLMVYLCVGVFWVLSFSFKTTTLRRFSLEMVLFIAVTLAIRLSSPHLFDTDKITQSLTMPAPGSSDQAENAAVQKTSAAQLKQDAWDLNRTTRMLIAGELKEEQQWADMVTALKKTYRGLPAEERSRLEPNYRATIDLDKAVKAWQSDSSAENVDKVYVLIESIDTFDW